MGRRKKETFYQLLNRRIREHNEAAEAAQAAKAAEAAKAAQEAEERNKSTNASRCKTYRNRHLDSVKAAIKKWNEKFKAEHGMSYATFHYRQKHGLL